MHLLAAQPGLIDDGSEAVDLGQSPGDIIVLSAADSEIAALAAAQDRNLSENPDAPSLRLANLMLLGHNMSVDLYLEQIIDNAKLVIVRLLGGRGYWTYGVEQISARCRARGIPVAWLPGDDQPDAELTGLSTVAADASHRLWQYCVQGGGGNALSFIRYAGTLMNGIDGLNAPTDYPWREPAPLMRAGLYWPGQDNPSLKTLPHQDDRPRAAILFYRALIQGANTAVIDALITALDQRGLNPLPIFATSLKDPLAADIVRTLLHEAPPEIILNGTGFALSSPGAERTQTPFDESDCPILQVIFSGGGETAWREGTRGLSARDIAMNVALPEVDGRILTRAVSFKGQARRSTATQTDIVEYQPVADRVDFTAQLAAAWARLRRKSPAERRVGLILANYPNRDGRLGNGVGLDTPAGSVNVLNAMAAAGYRLDAAPKTGAALIERLAAGPTNAGWRGRDIRETLSFADYQIFFASLPKTIRDAVQERWGPPENDPFYIPGAVDCGAFAISAYRCGNVVIALQPARGYNIDPVTSYHDPALPPPHNYLAFYAWLRTDFCADAVIHMGKHGNLEWLPGKALALSAECFPEVALGPMPNLYPFIVNDPGEGSQAKRRSQAVIIDHMTPPLTRAESYGPLRDLEQLVDEYYEAAGLDPRRLKVLGAQILELAQSTGLDRDCGMTPDADETEALAALDNYLCELKEMQIRDGLHIFGDSPVGGQLDDLLVALTRTPRITNARSQMRDATGNAPGATTRHSADASLIRALAADFDMDFDPLDCVPATPWTGPRPNALTTPLAPMLAADEAWRTQGDTVERLELLATGIVSGAVDAPGAASRAVVGFIDTVLRPNLARCGPAEIEGLLRGLNGNFVPPGPSGAPTRGRPDVLPTGRNFYSLDTRTVPTPAAWLLGWKSAQMLVERHAQDHGSWPSRMAISAWGTSNMRTGGDDIAQAMALMGVRPCWDSASRRVTGFEIMPLDVLDRPRVDVTLRISGFFRDAFPGLIDLFDSAARAVAALDESEKDNPLAARVAMDAAQFQRDGLDAQQAQSRAGARVFGSKPGAYGAGLQALIDEGGWTDRNDLARAYIAWGGFRYGGGAEGESAHGLFEARLRGVDAVVHNQDNREHDLLDSDDYYQFEGGLTAAVESLSGQRPVIYHNDHSRPESPKIRTLDEEIARVVRARAVNPKWIKGVMRHGYKGAFEIAATVDYLFAFAAAAGCVADHHFDAVYDAYIDDDEVRNFIAEANPEALREIAARLAEAQTRGLWRPRRNTAFKVLEDLSKTTQH